MSIPNAIDLRPRTLAELLDQAFRLYRNNFVKFIGIVAIALVPIQIVQFLLNLVNYGGASGTLSYSAAMAGLGSNLLIVLLNFIFVSGVATAALTSAISSSYLGEPVTIGGAFSRIRSSWGRLFGAFILLGLFSLVMILASIIPCVGWLTGPGIIVFVSVAVSPLVAPIIVIEKLSVSSSIRRAWDLVRRRFWWIVLYFGIIDAFNLLVIQGPVQIISTAIQQAIASPLASSQLVSSTILVLVISSITTILLSLIYIPLQSTCATLVYFDLRIRQEGFDLAMMANQAAEAPVSTVDLAGQTSAPVGGNLVTGKELVNFALITIVAAAFYVILTLALVQIPGLLFNY